MQHLLLIALGGSLGALARYGLARGVQMNLASIFPWGTLAVNLSGSFLIGLFFELFERAMITADLRSFIAIGFLGAYTTFSTFGLETVNLLRDGEYALALANVALSTVLGLAMVIAGLYFSRAMIKLSI